MTLALERCRYGGFSGGGVTGLDRKRWLGMQHPKFLCVDFRPQPWEQCAKVLREMGHAEDARHVLIEKEKRQRAERARRPWYLRWWFWFWDHMLGGTVRYGHKPLVALWWLAGFALFGTWVFHDAATADAMKPNSPVVLRADEWAACAPTYVAGADGPSLRWRGHHESQLACFLDQPEAASYPQFNAGLYSLDTLLPIVSMQMQGFWIPDDRVEPVGTLARWYLWTHIAAGWALSLLAVAGFSGLVTSD